MKYVYLFGGAIGDSLVGTHLGHALSESNPGTTLILLTTRSNPFVRELVQKLPYVVYQECIKERSSTWWTLVWLAASPSAVCVFEPTDVPLPPWWKLILLLATRFPGSKEVRSQLVGHERSAPPRVKKIIVHPEDNLFTVNVPRILSAWGITPMNILPSLPLSTCPKQQKPYIVFHFFAGSYRRSWPIEKAKPLLERARALFPEHEFVLTAALNERERAEEMIEGIVHAHVEAGLCAGELVQHLSCCDLIVGVASGVTHVSSLLGKPTVALANLSDPYWLPSYAPHTTILANKEECRCKGNKEGDCSYHTPGGIVYRCLYYIPTEQVIGAMKSVLP